MLKYIGQQAENEIRTALNKALELKPGLYFKLYDSESFLGKFDTVDSVLEEMDGGDEWFTVNLCEKDTCLGCLYINMDICDVIQNYSANDFCERIMK